MRFDLSSHMATRDPNSSWSDLLAETRDRVVLAEELGYDGVWFGEHHFDIVGTDVVPNPIMLATDLAARTSRIRLGMAAVSLPLWHPIRLAEDIAMLDHFSGGRVDVALSRGILSGEILAINPDADRSNEKQSREIFAEHLHMMKEAWTSDPFNWQSDRYKIPFPGSKWGGRAYADYQDENGCLQGLLVLPRPLQSPIPPLYAVTQQADGVREAARQGLGVITSHPTTEKMKLLNEAYREVADEVGYAPHVGRSATVARDFCIAETDAEARQLCEGHLEERFNAIARIRGLGEWLNPGEDPEDPKLKGAKGFDIMNERDLILVGSPQTVIDRMVRMAETLGADHWLLTTGRLNKDDAENTMRLMAEEVMPEVRRRVGDLHPAQAAVG